MQFKPVEEIGAEIILKMAGFTVIGLLFLYYAFDLLRADTPDKNVNPFVGGA